jgi:RNA polymerase sigma factor (sigma-70 family)
LSQKRAEIVAWVGSHIIPHEADLRRRLRAMAVPDQEVSDIVQDTYVSLSQLASIAHIQNGRAYFFQAARNVLLQRIRRQKIVRIDNLTEFEELAIVDEDPGPERRASGRQELMRIQALIDALPERCRQIFELRRIQGLSQKQVAEHLELPEHTIEAQSSRGLKLILKALAGQEEALEQERPQILRKIKKVKHEQQRHE